MFRLAVLAHLLLPLALGAGTGIIAAPMVDAWPLDPRLVGHPKVAFRVDGESIEVPTVRTAGRGLVVRENATAAGGPADLALPAQVRGR
jgi:hypothetical protein